MISQAKQRLIKIIFGDAALERRGEQSVVEKFDSEMTALFPREREVLELRFGLKDGNSHSLDELAQGYGITRERVRQIEARALRKLRNSCLQPHVDPPKMDLSKIEEEFNFSKPITVLNLSIRTHNSLELLGIVTLGDLVERAADHLLEGKNFGMTSLNEVRKKLLEIGFKLRWD